MTKLRTAYCLGASRAGVGDEGPCQGLLGVCWLLLGWLLGPLAVALTQKPESGAEVAEIVFPQVLISFGTTPTYLPHVKSGLEKYIVQQFD